jgi:transcriptional regulator with XRE-family HTH domain
VSFDLRTARVNAGLSRQQLADECEVSRETIRRLELKVGGVTPPKVKPVADRFGVLVTDIVPIEDMA